MRRLLSVTLALGLMISGCSPKGGEAKGAANADTQNRNNTMAKSYDRVKECKDNYRALFGGEALSGKGNDPEMMDILQKFIFGDVFSTGKLDPKTREMITCTVLSTLQTLPQLKAHSAAALNVGVTPLELREAVYLCAPFIGFPRTLNAIATIDEVFKEKGISLPLESSSTVTEGNRHEKGASIQGPLYGSHMSEMLSSLPEGYGDKVSEFLTDYLFGDIYSREGLSVKQKEMLSFCILTALSEKDQLKAHVTGNLKAGNSREDLCAAALQCLPYVGFPAAINALTAIRDASEDKVSY